MSDDLANRLAALQPSDLPPALQVRLAEPPVVRGKIRWLWALAPLSAAAIWLLAPEIERPASHPAPLSRPTASELRPSDFHVYLPVKETSTLVGVEDVTVIDPHPGHPIRLVRATWIDDVTYAGDDGHSTIHHQEPRAQIIPIALEAY